MLVLPELLPLRLSLLPRSSSKPSPLCLFHLARSPTQLLVVLLPLALALTLVQDPVPAQDLVPGLEDLAGPQL